MRALRLLGWVFVLAFVALGSCAPVHAAEPQHYKLVLAVYSTAAGHKSTFRGYKDVIHIPGYASAEACQTAGEAAVERFQAQRRADDLTQDLLDFVCLKVQT